MAGEITVAMYEEVSKAHDPKLDKIIMMNLTGLGQGIEWYNTMAKDSKLYCTPSQLTLGVSNYEDILNRQIKGLRMVDPDYDTDSLPLGLVLLQGLIRTFPCK